MATNSSDRKALLTRFFRALPDAGGTDAVENDKYYVDRKLGETSFDPVNELMTRVTMSEGAAAYLFSGMRGAGKTTELVRIGRLLENEDCVVFYTDIGNYINLRLPLGVEDTILAMLGALSDAFNLRFTQDVLGESYWSRFVNFLTRTNITVDEWKVKGDAAGAGLEVKGSLQTEPVFRQNLRRALNNSADAFLRDAREYAASLVSEACKLTGKQRVVLIVDSLERVSASTGDETKMFDGLKEVFFNQREKLRFDTLTVIYSVPPFLDAVIPGVAAGFGGLTFGLPHFKVGRMEAQQEFKPNPEGVAQMLAVVKHRFPEWDKVLSQHFLERLAFESGGNVRRYFILIRDMLVKLQGSPFVLPLAAEQTRILDSVLQTAREPFQWFNDLDRLWLSKIARESKVSTAGPDDLPTVLRLFDTSLILDYRNGERWYQILPLVRPLLNT